MEIRKAGMEDLEALFQERIEFIMGLRNDEVYIPEEFKQNTYEFMKEHMADDTLVTWIAEDNGVIISTAMVSYYEILPLMSNLTGKTGYILNVFTKPEYRRQGITTRLLNKLVEDAMERKVGKLYLSATDMGKPVYEKFGFENLTKDMVYIIN